MVSSVDVMPLSANPGGNFFLITRLAIKFSLTSSAVERSEYNKQEFEGKRNYNMYCNIHATS